MDRYSRRVFWSEKDGGFIAVCPEFPKLSAFGESAREALAELDVVLEMAIETFREERWELPDPQVAVEHSGQTRVRFPRSLHALLAAQADLEGVSLNTLLVTYAAEGLGRSREADRIEARLLPALREIRSTLSQFHADVVRLDAQGAESVNYVQDPLLKALYSQSSDATYRTAQ